MTDVSDRLEIKVICAEDLYPVMGLPPSAYVEIYVGQDVLRTKPFPESENPTWNGGMMIFTQLVVRDIDTIQVYVRHYDIFTGKDTCIGAAFIPMSTFYSSPCVELDDYYDLSEDAKWAFEDNAQGRVRLSITYFNTIDDDVVMDPGERPLAPNLLRVSCVIKQNYKQNLSNCFSSGYCCRGY